MSKFFRRINLGVLIAVKYLARNWRQVFLTVAILLVLSFILLKLSFAKQDSLSEGIIGTYQENDLPESVTRLLSESLVEPDFSGRMVAKLASSWEVNSDATVFKFKLRPNLHWIDGSTISSQDLEFNITDVEVSYPDSTTIVFKLKDSFSPLPSLLTRPLLKKGTLLGTGPYKIARIEKSRIFITKLTLTTLDKQNHPQLMIRFYPNEKIATTAFEIGEIQSLLAITNLSDFKSPGVAFQKQVTNHRVIAILYNTKDDLLSNRSLRQALGYSAPNIDGEKEAKTSIQPSSWAYFSEVNDYLANQEAAKAALSRAKNSLNEGALKKEITLTTTPQLQRVGEKVISSWKDLGLKAVLRVESGIPQNFQALLIAQNIPLDPDQYSLWHSTQTKTNLTKYSSARVDKALEDGRKLIKESDRKAKYEDFQKTLLEDSPATFLYFPTINIVYRKKVEDILKSILVLQM